MSRLTACTIAAMLTMATVCSCKTKPGETAPVEHTEKPTVIAPPVPQADMPRAHAKSEAGNSCAGHPIDRLEWIPGGTSVVVDNTYLLDVSTGQWRRLSTDPDWRLSFAPDGKNILSWNLNRMRVTQVYTLEERSIDIPHWFDYDTSDEPGCQGEAEHVSNSCYPEDATLNTAAWLSADRIYVIQMNQYLGSRCGMLHLPSGKWSRYEGTCMGDEWTTVISRLSPERFFVVSAPEGAVSGWIGSFDPEKGYLEEHNPPVACMALGYDLFAGKEGTSYFIRTDGELVPEKDIYDNVHYSCSSTAKTYDTATYIYSWTPPDGRFELVRKDLPCRTAFLSIDGPWAWPTRDSVCVGDPSGESQCYSLPGQLDKNPIPDGVESPAEFISRCFQNMQQRKPEDFEACLSAKFLKQNPKLLKGLIDPDKLDLMESRLEDASIEVTDTQWKGKDEAAVLIRIEYASGEVEEDGAYWYILTKQHGKWLIDRTHNDFYPGDRGYSSSP